MSRLKKFMRMGIASLLVFGIVISAWGMFLGSGKLNNWTETVRDFSPSSDHSSNDFRPCFTPRLASVAPTS